MQFLDGFEDRPRPLTDGAAKLVEALPLASPFFVLISRSALTPKLVRRAMGEAGGRFGSASPSSMAFSLMDEVGELLLPKLL